MFEMKEKFEDMSLVNRGALFNKWRQTGLLKDLRADEGEKMAFLLEKCAKKLLKVIEDKVMNEDGVMSLAGIIFPIMRRVFQDNKEVDLQRQFDATFEVILDINIRSKFEDEHKKCDCFNKLDCEVELCDFLTDKINERLKVE